MSLQRGPSSLSGDEDTSLSHILALKTAVDGLEDIIKLLVIENEAYFESLGERRGIALCTAASIGSESIVRHLLEWGADPDDQGGCHGTALHAAANRGFEDIVKLLLDNEADPNVQTRELGTVLQMAAAQGSEVIAKLLLEKGDDPNVRRGHFGNAMSAARRTWSQHRDAVIKLLLDYGATDSDAS